MLLESLREQVLRANKEIARRGLAPHTFGNASGVDRSGAKPLVVIKPSGVDYDSLTAADLVITDLDGNVVDGRLRPSSDLDTHTLLYREFPQIGGIVHTHSEFATAWAQACRPFRASAPPTLTTFTARFLLLSRLAPKKLPQATFLEHRGGHRSLLPCWQSRSGGCSGGAGGWPRSVCLGCESSGGG